MARRPGERAWIGWLSAVLTECADSLVLNADAWATSGLTPRQIIDRHYRLRQAVAQLEAVHA